MNLCILKLILSVAAAINGEHPITPNTNRHHSSRHEHRNSKGTPPGTQYFSLMISIQDHLLSESV